MADAGRCILANPDISGIGVRTAIYAQNLLSFGPAIWALWDGKVSVGELDSVETQSMTILITAFAILVSAIVQALTLGLSNFHVSIILDLSWMNNTSTFIYFLLYIRHKTQARDESQETEPMDLKWSTWRSHVFEAFHFKSNNQDQAKEQIWKADNKPRSLFKRIFTKFVLVVGSVHLSLMAAIGLWLWTQPSGFSISQPCSLEARILFGYVPLGSSGLRVWSMIIYSTFLLPFFNLVLPMCGFLALQIYWPTISTFFSRKPSSSGDIETPKMETDDLKVETSSEKPSIAHDHTSVDAQIPGQQASETHTPSLVPTHIGLAVLFIINVFFVIDIETTISRSTPLRDHGDGDWTFGQTLALLLLLVPLRDLVETILDRREARLLEIQHDRDEHMMAPQLEKAVKKNTITSICDLAFRGALLNILVEVDNRTRSPLSTVVAAPKSTKRMVDLLLDKEADVNLTDTEFGSPLIAAVEKGSMELVQLLLSRGANLNIKAEKTDYPTALQMAVRNGSVEIVKLLLVKGADPNVNGGCYHTALQIAALNGSIEIVGLLLNNTIRAKPNTKGGEGSALHAAILKGHKAVVRLLCDYGADPNLESKKTDTPLRIAVQSEKTAIVTILLRHNARYLAASGKAPKVNTRDYKAIREKMKEADFRLSEDNRIIQFTDKNVDCWEDVSAYDNTDDETQRSIQEKPRRSAKIKALGHAHKPDDSMKERSLGEADKKIVKEPGDVQIESAPQVNTLAPVTPERTQDEGGVQPGQKKMNHRFAGGSDKKSKERLRERAKVLVVAHDSVADDTDGSVEGWEEQPPQVEAPGFPPSESRPPTPSDEAPTERASPQLDFPPDEE